MTHSNVLKNFGRRYKNTLNFKKNYEPYQPPSYQIRANSGMDIRWVGGGVAWGGGRCSKQIKFQGFLIDVLSCSPSNAPSLSLEIELHSTDFRITQVEVSLPWWTPTHLTITNIVLYSMCTLVVEHPPILPLPLVLYKVQCWGTCFWKDWRRQINFRRPNLVQALGSGCNFNHLNL